LGVVASGTATAAAAVATAIASILESAFAVATITSVAPIASVASVTALGTIAAIPVLGLALLLRLRTSATLIALRVVPHGIRPIGRSARAWRRAVRAARRTAIALIRTGRRRWGGSLGLGRRAPVGARGRRGFDFYRALLARAFARRTALGVIEIRVVRRLGVGRIGWTFPASATWGPSTFSHAVVE
jgi:hypothetical protein